MTTEPHTLGGAYVLDAVDDLERVAVVRHLRTCASCALEVFELREAAARLAVDAAVPPPPGLRDSVLAAIARTRQEGPGGSGRTTVATPARWRRAIAAAAAAGIVAAGAGTTTWVVAEHQAEKVRAEAAAERSRIAQVLSAPDVVVRNVVLAGGGKVAVVVAPSRQAAVAVLSGLAAPGADRAYELWLIGDGPAKPVGLVAARQAAGQVDTTTLLPSLSGANTFGVTREPANGSPQPTGEPVAKVPLV